MKLIYAQNYMSTFRESVVVDTIEGYWAIEAFKRAIPGLDDRFPGCFRLEGDEYEPKCP